MEKIKRFITCHIPVYACNFRCSYCYVGQHQGAYKGGTKDFAVSPKEVAEFFSPERTGGFCYFNLCGLGETFLHPQLISLVYELTKEGHYCDVITNGVLTNKIEELISALDENQRKHLFLKFSFHYLQLEERNLLETFVSNVNKAKSAGVAFTVEITPHDELIPYIDEIKNVSLKNFGALPHITVARNEATKKIEILSKLSRKDYKKTWQVFDSALFDFKFDIFNQKRKEFCYAGQNSLSVNLADGSYSQCYCGKQLGFITEIEKPINFEPIGKCSLPHCFNGHAFLAYGNIPSLKTSTYAEERDRITQDGGHWLNKTCLDFFSTKTCDSNFHFSSEEEKGFLHKKIIQDFSLKKVVRKLKRMKSLFLEKREMQKGEKDFEKALSSFSDKKNKILLLMPTNYGNIGDLFICEAEKLLIKKYFPETEVDELLTKWLPLDCVKKLSRIIDNYKLIAVTGGGFLGSLWEENENIAKEVYKNFSDKKIVIFPQTIYYRNNYVPPSTLALYKNCKSLTVFVRDNSYSWVKNELLKDAPANVFNVPDIVLSLNYSKLKNNRNGILCVFRNDKENITSDDFKIYINKLCNELNEKTTMYDTVFPYFIKFDERKKFAEEKLEPFLHSKLVITNRLHGMILSVVTGTPCIALDNISKKISGTYNLWLKSNENVFFAESEKDITKDVIRKMLSKPSYSYAPEQFESYWNQIAESLR